MRSWRFELPVAALALAFGLGATAAEAQPSLLNPGPVVPYARPGPAAPPPPPGLPGAVSNGAATPAARPPAESGLSPTAALFDAINRGDLAAARDAIGRGAQLDARNVLGMTPLELAVDLARNDIAFLLLSIEHEGRAAAASAGGSLALSVPPAPAAVPSLPEAKASLPGDGSVAALLLSGQPAAVAAGGRRPAAAPVPIAPPAGQGGGPNPAVGFLGFGPAGGVPQQN